MKGQDSDPAAKAACAPHAGLASLSWFDQDLRSCLLRVSTLCLGVLGIVLTALPDMFPESKWISRPSPLAALEVGLAELSRLDEEDAEGLPISVLRKGESGYDAILGLLRTCDPTLSGSDDSAADSPTRNEGAIVATSVFGWSNPQGSLPVVRPVLIRLREGQLRPVCELRDLGFLIHDRKIRFWSRLGSVLAIVALFVQATLADAAKPSRRIEEPEPELDVPPSSENDCDAQSSVTQDDQFLVSGIGN